MSSVGVQPCRTAIMIPGALAWLGFATILCAQVAAVTADDVAVSIDRSEVDIADPFRCTVSVVAPADTRVSFPDPGETLGPFMVVRFDDQFDVPEPESELRRWSRSFVLESWESGELQIPSIQLSVTGEVVSTEPVTVTVQSSVEPQTDPIQFRDLKEIVEIEPDSRWGGWLTLGVAILAGLGVLGWFLLRRPQKELAPDEWAYARLGDLESTSAFRDGERSEILPPLADVVREYIQRRFRVAAPKQTTSEFLATVHHDVRMPEPRKAELQRLLAEVDQIKFASLRPDNARLHETFEQIRSFVRETTITASDKRSHEVNDVEVTD